MEIQTEDNSSVQALIDLLAEGDLAVEMQDYGDFEKYGSIGQKLPENNAQISTGSGDVTLYQGNLISIDYDTNNWNLTLLGHVQNLTQDELKSILGDGDVTVVFSLSSGKNEIVNVDDGFLLINGGSFLMGSPETERMRQEDETQHEVSVSAFYVDPYEVRQSDYERIMGENPSHFKGENLPVENVTWYDAIEYCNRLSESAGLTPVYTVDGDTVIWDRSANGYRLLTEAEWEYVARAGTQNIFYNGDQVHSDQYNFEASYPFLIEENYVHRQDPTVKTSHYRGRTIEVSELAPNAFGLYNTLGNVSEWCFDYYGDYDLENTTDPAGADSGHLRINRGGSYIDFGKHLRVAYRSATNPIDPDQNLGFRICRNAEAKDETVVTFYDLDITIPENPKMIIVYYSYSGNTEEAAHVIQRKTGADIFEITMVNPYRGNIYDVSQADTVPNIHPPITGTVENIDEYDVILLGYPTWWATMPMPVYSFLDSVDLSGKTIVSFSSHGGTMFGDSVSDLCKAEPGAYVGEAYEFNYSGWDDREISDWLALNHVPEL